MRIAASLALLLLAGGCDSIKSAATSVANKAQEVGAKAKQELTDAGKKLTSKADDVAKKAQEAVGAAGSFAIEVDGKVDTKACYAVFVPSVAGRRPLLQLRSYRSGGSDYPAVLVHAPVDATSLSGLANQTIEGRMFIQDANGVVWDNVGGPSVTLKIGEVTDKELKAEFTGGQLLNSDTGQPSEVRGSLTAVIGS